MTIAEKAEMAKNFFHRVKDSAVSVPKGNNNLLTAGSLNKRFHVDYESERGRLQEPSSSTSSYSSTKEDGRQRAKKRRSNVKSGDVNQVVLEKTLVIHNVITKVHVHLSHNSVILSKRNPDLSRNSIGARKATERLRPSWWTSISAHQTKILMKLQSLVDPLNPDPLMKITDVVQVFHCLKELNSSFENDQCVAVLQALTKQKKKRSGVSFDRLMYSIARNDDCQHIATNTRASITPPYTEWQKLLLTSIVKITPWKYIWDSQLEHRNNLHALLFDREECSKYTQYDTQEDHMKDADGSTSYHSQQFKFTEFSTAKQLKLTRKLKLKCCEMKREKMKILLKLPESELLPCVKSFRRKQLRSNVSKVKRRSLPGGKPYSPNIIYILVVNGQRQVYVNHLPENAHEYRPTQETLFPKRNRELYSSSCNPAHFMLMA